MDAEEHDLASVTLKQKCLSNGMNGQGDTDSTETADASGNPVEENGIECNGTVEADCPQDEDVDMLSDGANKSSSRVQGGEEIMAECEDHDGDLHMKIKGQDDEEIDVKPGGQDDKDVDGKYGGQEEEVDVKLGGQDDEEMDVKPGGQDDEEVNMKYVGQDDEERDVKPEGQDGCVTDVKSEPEKVDEKIGEQGDGEMDLKDGEEIIINLEAETRVGLGNENVSDKSGGEKEPVLENNASIKEDGLNEMETDVKEHGKDEANVESENDSHSNDKLDNKCDSDERAKRTEDCEDLEPPVLEKCEEKENLDISDKEKSDVKETMDIKDSGGGEIENLENNKIISLTNDDENTPKSRKAEESITRPQKDETSGKGKGGLESIVSKLKNNREKKGQENESHSNGSDSLNDDIEIVGESRVTPKKNMTAPVPTLIPGAPSVAQNFMGSGVLITSSAQNPMLVQSLTAASRGIQGMSPGFGVSGMMGLSGFAFGSSPAQGSQGVSMLTPAVAPPKPKSSLDQIELIRWEIQNRINTRPKYFKPNTNAELGPLAKYLFDIGSDMIKESVYHDLVKIQSKKNDDNRLSDKEKEDLGKLKEIEKDLYATIGHLKLKLRKKCRVCNFQTESLNVMFFHKQFPHEDNKNLKCCHCSYSTKQHNHYKFHMEAEHGMQPRLHDKKAFNECNMCPYESNQEAKLNLHKQRCLKQFRPLFNLHPSCLSGAEINLCLENIFYKPVIPKNLKLLQQKHAQQQAALAEARRQQAEMQALAAQKNAAALAAKKQQQIQQQRLQTQQFKQQVAQMKQQARQFQAIAPAPRYPGGRMPAPPNKLPLPPKPGQSQDVRYNSLANQNLRPTVANMLNNRSKAGAASGPIGAPAIAASGFEVCEICGGYVKDRKALRIHFFYAHRIDLPFNLFERNQAPLYCATCYVRFWTAQGLRKHIDTHKEENQTRGVVGKCISCGHHVLNLLLHMRIVHNREMQHYINALMCMFCGGHFNSRQDCERHIVKAHGTIDPQSGAVKSGSGPQQQQRQSQKGSSNQKKAGNNSLVKGSVCVLCNLNFGRNVDLTRHCMRMHHTCMKCGMVVIDKASLMKHTCLSSPSGTRNCDMCGETGFHPAYYVKHLRDKHLKKFSIRVARVNKSTIERWTKRPCPFDDPKEILVEISDDSDEDVPLNKLKGKAASTPKKSSVKRPRMGPASKVKKPKQVVDVDEVVSIVDDEEEKENEVEIEEEKELVQKEEKSKEIDKESGTEEKEVIDLDSTRDVSSDDEDDKEKRSDDEVDKNEILVKDSEDSKSNNNEDEREEGEKNDDKEREENDKDKEEEDRELENSNQGSVEEEESKDDDIVEEENDDSSNQDKEIKLPRASKRKSSDSSNSDRGERASKRKRSS